MPSDVCQGCRKYQVVDETTLAALERGREKREGRA